MSEVVAEQGLSNADARGAQGKATRLALRFGSFVLGLLINSVGIVLINKALLGTAPISSVPYVLSLTFEPTLGEFTFALNMLFLVAEIALLRRDFHPIQLLQVVANLIFSSFIDLSMGLLSWVSPQSLPEMALALLLGCCILACGISIEVAPNVTMVPGEGIVHAISTAAKRPFGSCKLCFDTSLALLACALSFVFFGYLNGPGVGTIVSALIVGPIVNVINAHVPLIDAIRGLREPVAQTA